MEKIEDRLLRHILSFCQERELIATHRVKGPHVHFFVGSEPHSLERKEALRYLVRLLEDENLSGTFLQAFRTETPIRSV